MVKVVCFYRVLQVLILKGLEPTIIPLKTSLLQEHRRALKHEVAGNSGVGRRDGPEKRKREQDSRFQAQIFTFDRILETLSKVK
jgi:hypothetical protein